MGNEEFGRILKQALEEKVQDMAASPYLLERVKMEAEARSRKERNFMGISKKIAVAAAVCVMSVTAYAAVSSFSGAAGYSSTDIKTFAQLEKADDKLGLDAKFVESFSNGLTFSYAGTGEDFGVDENGNQAGAAYKNISVTYESKDGRSVTLGISEGDPFADDGAEWPEGYTTMKNKFVPDGYEVTPEEIALQEAGKLNVAFGGGQEVEIMESEGYYWEADGLYYHLTAFDMGFGEAAMAQMAAEIMQ